MLLKLKWKFMRSLFKKNDNSNQNEVLNEVIEACSLLVDPDKIFLFTINRIKEIFSIHDFLLIKSKATVFCDISNKIEVAKESKFINWIKTNRTICSLKDKSIFQYVNSDEPSKSISSFDYALPSIIHNDIVFIAFFNKETYKELLKNDTFNFFEVILKITALSFQNSCRIFSETNKIKVDAQNEKMISIGMMASKLAHEIKNPLTSIRSSMQFIGSFVKEDELQELTSDLIFEVDRIKEITTKLLNFSRPKILNKKDVNIYEFFNIFFSTHKRCIEENNITLIKNYNEKSAVLVTIDEDEFNSAFLNLLLNSIDALTISADNNRIIEISIKENKDKIDISYSDTGCGMNDDELDKMFIPFFSAKQKGTGLGLAIVKNIFDLHNISVKVYSKRNIGTKFEFSIPVK